MDKAFTMPSYSNPRRQTRFDRRSRGRVRRFAVLRQRLVFQRLDKAGIQVLFTGLKTQVLDVLTRTGLYARIGAGRFFRTEDQALEHVWQQLGDNHEVDCPLNVVCQVKPAG